MNEEKKYQVTICNSLAYNDAGFDSNTNVSGREFARILASLNNGGSATIRHNENGRRLLAFFILIVEKKSQKTFFQVGLLTKWSTEQDSAQMLTSDSAAAFVHLFLTSKSDNDLLNKSSTFFLEHGLTEKKELGNYSVYIAESYTNKKFGLITATALKRIGPNKLNAIRNLQIDHELVPIIEVELMCEFDYTRTEFKRKTVSKTSWENNEKVVDHYRANDKWRLNKTHTTVERTKVPVTKTSTKSVKINGTGDRMYGGTVFFIPTDRKIYSLDKDPTQDGTLTRIEACVPKNPTSRVAALADLSKHDINSAVKSLIEEEEFLRFSSGKVTKLTYEKRKIGNIIGFVAIPKAKAKNQKEIPLPLDSKLAAYEILGHDRGEDDKPYTAFPPIVWLFLFLIPPVGILLAIKKGREKDRSQSSIATAKKWFNRKHQMLALLNGDLTSNRSTRSEKNEERVLNHNIQDTSLCDTEEDSSCDNDVSSKQLEKLGKAHLIYALPFTLALATLFLGGVLVSLLCIAAIFESPEPMTCVAISAGAILISILLYFSTRCFFKICKRACAA